MGRIDSSLVNKMESAVPAGKVQGSGWGTHVYLWQIHFDIWQIKIKKKKKGAWTLGGGVGCVPNCAQRTRLQLACRAHIGLTDSEAASQSLPSGWVMGLFIYLQAQSWACRTTKTGVLMSSKTETEKNQHGTKGVQDKKVALSLL